MGRLVVDEALPVGVRTAPLARGDAEVWLFAAVTMFGLLDLRFDPNPRFLNREFIRSMSFFGVLEERDKSRRPLWVGSTCLSLCFGTLGQAGCSTRAVPFKSSS